MWWIVRTRQNPSPMVRFRGGLQPVGPRPLLAFQLGIHTRCDVPSAIRARGQTRKIRLDKSSVKERAEPVAAGCPTRPRSSTSTGTMLGSLVMVTRGAVSYTHLRAHET